MKNKFYLSLVTLICFISTSFAGTETITILYTNSANGYLENCHCPENPYGGLTRRATYIEEQRKNKLDFLLVDTGDSFPPALDKIKIKYCLKSLEYMKYDALVVGDQELYAGDTYFDQIIKKEKLPYISANLMICDETACRAVTEPYLIKKIGNYKVALIGIISPEVFLLFPSDKIKHLIILDYLPILKRSIRNLRKEVDLIVLLSHMNHSSNLELAKKLSGIDIIIGGHSQVLLKEVVKIEDTLVLEAGKNGQYVGKLTLALNKDKKITSYTNKLIPLTEEIKDHKVILDYSKRYLKELKESQQKLLLKEDDF